MSEDSIIANTRTTLDDGAYTITLDKVDDYNNRIKELKAKGGNSFLYNGILVRSDKQNMAHSDYNKRSEEQTSELQSLIRTSYAVFGLKQNKSTHMHLQNTITYYTNEIKKQ